ncbi:MAG TPA: transposase [Myxococcota bacterium]|nr:transposase [Myxococcota bacterium]
MACPPPRKSPLFAPHGRKKLPPKLPVQRLQFTAEPGVCDECGETLEVFGEDVSSRLEWVPGYFRRLEIAREKCACPKHPVSGVVTAPGPAFAIDKGLCGNGLLAKVVVDKYADHIPLNRQVKRFRRQGVDVALSTMCDWVRLAAGHASMLVSAMLAELVAGDWLQSDATGFKVLEGSRNKPHRGHLYTWANTDRVVYTYAREGTGGHPAAVLADFAGTLVADGGGTRPGPSWRPSSPGACS